MVRIVRIIILYFSLITNAMAQDPFFSNNFLIPETLNPAFVGISESKSLGVLHRSQWPNFKLQIDSNFAFFNSWQESINSGIGISVVNQEQNFTNYNFTQIDFSYAYKVQLNDNWIFHPAIQLGYGTRSFNSSNIIFEDQIDILNGYINPFSSEFTKMNENLNFFDFSAGMLINNENFYLGTSLKHLNKPNISFLSNGVVPLDLFFSLNMGYQFTIADYLDIVYFPYETKMKLTSNYIKQGEFSRIDLEAALDFSNFYFGISSVTNLKNIDGKTALSSLGLFGGLNYEYFKFGYSYDFNMQKKLNLGGVYELFIMYRFDLFEECHSCPSN